MPTNPHLLPLLPKDAGAAQKVMDVQKQVNTLNSHYGVLGEGVRVTGGLISTSDDSPRIFMQGPLFGPPGFYVEDSGGVEQVWINETGLGLATGTDEVNAVGWYDGFSLKGRIGAYDEASGGLQTTMYLGVTSPDGEHTVELTLVASNTGSGLQSGLWISVDGAGEALFAT